MRTPAKPRRRIWPWIVLAAIAVIIAIAVTNTLQQAGVTPTAAPTATSAPTSTAPDVQPIGCLGGEARDSAMVLRAQAEASHSTNGAIEVATAFVRWLNQYPYPSDQDIAAVEDAAVSATAPTQDVAGFFASKPNLSGGLVQDEQTYYLSTIGGVYHLESGAPDSVVASIGTSLVIDGELSPTLKGSITVSMVWEDDRWKFVSSEGMRTTEDLFAIGREFTEGC